ncbi:uncharacterized protein LOC119686101 [Teleopsis dalmanni]|uniref:uncharacterized protein LOC119686101 n=1 Tax=Teleopsis dalmanni TaxID=139649 RepID=UPI0018CD5706|nr:uncharacterized protein LOC119686101 [Teleopsis dalmanni]
MNCLFGVSVLVIALSVLSGSVTGQSTNPPATTPVNCSDATMMSNIDISALYGTWYEVARQPSIGAACIEVDIGGSSQSTDIVYVNTTYASNMNMLNQNKTVSQTFNKTLATANGSITLYSNISSTNYLFKVLSTDNTNYAFVCGYTSNNSSSIGVILTRTRYVNATYLGNLEAQAAINYSDFSATSMYTITQNEGCVVSGAATLVPFISLLTALVYSLMKFLN